MNLDQAIQIFKENFPNINIDGLSCHGEIEQEVCKHVEEFTEDQWKVLLSNNLDMLFQDGLSGISWNTDRHNILYAIRKHFPLITSTSREETWYTVRTYWHNVNGVCFKLVIEEPHLISAGSFHYYISIEDQMPTAKTHTACIFCMNDTGKVFIKYQKTGTLEECEDYVQENAHSGDVIGFRIFKRKND